MSRSCLQNTCSHEQPRERPRVAAAFLKAPPAGVTSLHLPCIPPPAAVSKAHRHTQQHRARLGTTRHAPHTLGTREAMRGGPGFPRGYQPRHAAILPFGSLSPQQAQKATAARESHAQPSSPRAGQGRECDNHCSGLGVRATHAVCRHRAASPLTTFPHTPPARRVGGFLQPRKSLRHPQPRRATAASAPRSSTTSSPLGATAAR